MHERVANKGRGIELARRECVDRRGVSRGNEASQTIDRKI